MARRRRSSASSRRSVHNSADNKNADKQLPAETRKGNRNRSSSVDSATQTEMTAGAVPSHRLYGLSIAFTLAVAVCAMYAATDGYWASGKFPFTNVLSKPAKRSVQRSNSELGMSHLLEDKDAADVDRNIYRPRIPKSAIPESTPHGDVDDLDFTFQDPKKLEPFPGLPDMIPGSRNNGEGNEHYNMEVLGNPIVADMIIEIGGGKLAIMRANNA